MTAGPGWLPAPVEDLFGTEATAEESYGVLTVDIPPASWPTALQTARDRLGCTYFDWLSAVDEPGTGFRVAAHVVALAPVRRLLLRTTVPHESPTLPSAVSVYAGAAWHERETHEMFGVVFEGHPALDHLLLPETFEGHPLRKDFVLAARVAKAWPGAKEPGESDHGGPRRRQMLPPGVPDPNEWGPLKGQLPPAPTRERPARRTRTAAQGSAGQTAPPAPGDTPRRSRSATEGSASQRPTPPTASPEAPSGPRRTRSASEGSASQRTDTTSGGPVPGGTASGPRRTRSASEGSASQAEPGAAAPRRTRRASDGSASQTPATPSAPAPPPSAAAPAPEGAPATQDPAPPDRPAAAGPTPDGAPGTKDPPPEQPAASGPTPKRSAAPGPAPRSTDAPWHHARPAFDEPEEPEHPEDPEDPEDPQDPEDSEGGPQ
jgi:NADH:ubiquinone oxidoreductase subunit C